MKIVVTFSSITKSKYIVAMIAVTSTFLPQISNAQQQNITENTMEEVVVTGSAIYRDRTQAIAPQLEYGTSFFQRFEPVSVGDMLKRTPGVAFSSDVGEYDSPQLRGIGNGYTQILINGKKVPSASDDRSYFVDRIPAEIVEKIQIIRSPSADISGSGIGGVINIILKEGESLNGGSARAGITNVNGDENKVNASFAYGGNSDNINWSLTGSFQERFVPKEKTEEVFTDERELEEFQIENDVRDSDDMTVGGSVNFQLSEQTSLNLSANYIKTKREEDQDETTFKIEDGVRELDEVAVDDVDIDERTTIFGIGLNHQLSENINLNVFVDLSDIELEENAIVFEGDDFTFLELDEKELVLVEDELNRYGLNAEYQTNENSKYLFGILKNDKERFNSLSVTDDEGETEKQSFITDEDELAAFVKAEYLVSDNFSVEAGLRYTSTDRAISDLDQTSSKTNYSKSHLLPSVHASYDLENNGTIRFSLARTLRRPGFDQLNPIVFEDEPEDDDVSVGNPLLEDETSVGIDVGYEHPIFKRGIIGFNVFYRDVKNVIETKVVGESEKGGSIYSSTNSGDGSVWGLELDMSFPLSDRSGFFANATLLDSKITDPFTLRDRRFQDQPDYIYNIGLDHTLPEWDISMGFSLQGRGDSISVEYGEVEVLEYDPNLEIFVEKRFSNGIIAR